MKHSLNDSTDLLYLEGIEGSYIRELEVTVRSYENGGFILDRTMMHYQGGGQPGDKGHLVVNGKVATIYNVMKKGRKVLHLSNDIIDADKGKLILNWERRYKIMKMHTLQHALSSYLFNVGAMTVESEVFPGYGYITIDREVKDIPDGAYNISKDGRLLRRYDLDRKDLDPRLLKRCNLEKLPKSVEILSIVEIDGLDLCACAGTHLKNTAEIGSYWIRNMGNKIEFGLF